MTGKVLSNKGADRILSLLPPSMHYKIQQPSEIHRPYFLMIKTQKGDICIDLGKGAN